ncbi:hypothetical protein QUB80_16755 [Chlorogloeopsis sp. ULAP01]|nr:hypothetical protein [Chlorogloeopsis sp. ULAP01]MDM9382356.1 hypothetical protein [Chlorogloeopsis sp. ULAP01]
MCKLYAIASLSQIRSNRNLLRSNSQSLSGWGILTPQHDCFEQ